jgi:hypothetical protein
LPGYRVIEVDVSAASPAAGKRVSSIDWPLGSVPVGAAAPKAAKPDPDLTLAAGDRISLPAPIGLAGVTAARADDQAG